MHIIDHYYTFELQLKTIQHMKPQFHYVPKLPGHSTVPLGYNFVFCDFSYLYLTTV